jgi:hypothetical protein
MVVTLPTDASSKAGMYVCMPNVFSFLFFSFFGYNVVVQTLFNS